MLYSHVFRVLIPASFVFAFTLNLSAQIPSFELGHDGYTIFNDTTVAQGDFNNDGKPDLVYGGAAGSTGGSTDGVSLRLGNGDGTFQPPTAVGPVGDTILDLAAADLDQDGNLDVVALNIDGQFVVFYGNGNGTFQPAAEFATTASPRSLTVGHFFGDKYLDIAVGDENGGVELFRNFGGRNYTLANTIQVGTGQYPDVVRLRSGDLDGTGVSSIAVLAGNAAYVMWGANNGTFQTVQLASYVALSDLNVGNLNQDGVDDVLVSYTCNPTPTGAPEGPEYEPCQGIDVFYGQGNHKMIRRTVVTRPNTEAGRSPWAVDVNGDGIGDIALSGGGGGGGTSGLYIYMGNANGSFSQTPQTFFPTPGGVGDLVPGDWNRDGAIDFAQPMVGSALEEIYINGGNRAPCVKHTGGPSVTVCMPSNFAYLPSPVAVKANTTDSHTVTTLQQYIDSKLDYSVHAPSFTHSFTLAPGAHLLVTKGWDSAGVSFRSDRSITVYNGTPYPACPAAPNSASICLPAGPTSGSPVHILANGDAAGVPSSAQLFIDGDLVVNNNGCYNGGGCSGGISYVDTSQNLSSGTHEIIFKLWDNRGNLYKTSKTVTVQ